MIIATAPYVAGYRVQETKGQVFGLVVRSRGLGGNLVAGLRSIVGGEIHEYTSLLEDTRRQAIDRMVQNATLVGANAIISFRFDSSELAGTMSEIVAYGTAVVLVPRSRRGADMPPPAPASPRRSSSRGRSRSPGSSSARIGVLLILGGIAVAAVARARRQPVLGAVPVRPGRGDRSRRCSSSGPATGRSTPSGPATAMGRAAASRGRREPRFRPTDERFVDPTTGSRCRSGSTRRPASGGTSRSADRGGSHPAGWQGPEPGGILVARPGPGRAAVTAPRAGSRSHR